MSPEFEQLVGRAVGDKQFRDALLKDPEEAAKRAGYNLSDQEIKALKEGIKNVSDRLSSDEIDKIFGSNGSSWFD